MVECADNCRCYYLLESARSPESRLRPDFTSMHRNALVMKGQSKALLNDMVENERDLITKFHDGAYKLFPKGCTEIPAVATCNQKFRLFGISHFNGVYNLDPICDYNVLELPGRISFIRDFFKPC